MKGGASPTDIQSIQKYFRAGHNAEAISNAMSIPLHCVESFHPEKHTALKERVRDAERRMAEEHKKKKDIMLEAKQEVKQPIEIKPAAGVKAKGEFQRPGKTTTSR